MKNLENACGYYQRFYQRPHEDNDPNKPQLWWDGYQWVIRPHSISHQNFDVIKPGRKVLVSNIPLQLNVLVNDFKDYLIKKIQEKNVVSKKDVNDINNIIKGIELNYENNTAVLAMESTEIAKRMVLLDGLILLGHTLRFSPYQDINSNDVSSSNISKAVALANSAQLSAKSAAIAFAAFQSFSNKGDSIQLNLNNEVKSISSKVIKLMNIEDSKEAVKFKSDKFEEILDDIKEEFSKFGNIVSAIIIKPKLEKIGAECCSVFIEYQDTKSAENCMKGMKGRRYEGREIRLAYIDEPVYKKEIL
jgi:RNA recognition motif-containing protein